MSPNLHQDCPPGCRSNQSVMLDAIQSVRTTTNYRTCTVHVPQVSAQKMGPQLSPWTGPQLSPWTPRTRQGLHRQLSPLKVTSPQLSPWTLGHSIPSADRLPRHRLQLGPHRHQPARGLPRKPGKQDGCRPARRWPQDSGRHASFACAPRQHTIAGAGRRKNQHLPARK